MLALLLLAIAPSNWAQEAPSREVLVKAAYLLNFARFVEWPSSTDAITIGVLGPDPFGGTLEAVVAGEQVRGRPLRVVHGATLAALGHVDLLYVATPDHVHQVLEDLGTQPVLTVADAPGFCQNGGIIQFLHQGSKLRFAINDAAARRHHLHLSAQLLSVAIPPPGGLGDGGPP